MLTATGWRVKNPGTQLSLFETRTSNEAFAVRVSARARRLTARVHVGGRVEIVVPAGRGREGGAGFRAAILAVDRPQGRGDAVPSRRRPSRCPQSVEFPLTGERFTVDWLSPAAQPLRQREQRLVAARRPTSRRADAAAGLAEACGRGAPRAAPAAVGGSIAVAKSRASRFGVSARAGAAVRRAAPSA